MRLINLWTQRLEEFVDDDSAPPYIILSHTWGSGEVTFQDLSVAASTLTTRPGWAKLDRFCSVARGKSHLSPGGGLVKYGWMDTCCIDKTSSAELSEAINSMFRWYRKAELCIVYLEDVEFSSHGQPIPAGFENARWFSRGWTLQELLAPNKLEFFDKHWVLICDKITAAEEISHKTKIDRNIVENGDLQSASIAQRMAWAADRQTTRAEDMAYCLMGIFDVNMGLVYGEGRQKAFMRLQEEILRYSDDHTIFAWDASHLPQRPGGTVGMLAPSPAEFRDSHDAEPLPDKGTGWTSMNKGVNTQMPIIEHTNWPGKKIALLSCCYTNRPTTLIGIKVERGRVNPAIITRTLASPVTVYAPDWQAFGTETVYLARHARTPETGGWKEKCRLFWETNQGFTPIRSQAFDKARWVTGANKGMTLVLSTGLNNSTPQVDPQATRSMIVFGRAGSLNAFCIVLELQLRANSALLSLVNLGALAIDVPALDAFITKFQRREIAVTLRESDQVILNRIVITARAETRLVEGVTRCAIVMSSYHAGAS